MLDYYSYRVKKILLCQGGSVPQSCDFNNSKCTYIVVCMQFNQYVQSIMAVVWAARSMQEHATLVSLELAAP